MVNRTRRPRGNGWRQAAIAVLALGLGCEAQLKPSNLHLIDFITQVSDAGGTISAAYHSGTAPAPGGGPSVTVAGITTMVNGGSSQQTVNGSATFTTAIMAMDGVDGYYELTLPGSVSTSDLVLSASPILGSSTTLPLEFAVTSGGVLGPYTLQNMHIVHVGTGDVQVSVSWSGASDVDLHVIDPNNEEVYYAHRTAASGGTLDLDSNAGCSIDNTNNENIVWPVGSAPAGTYTVRVDYWSACSVTQSDYVVTVHTTHGTTQFFTGSLTGAGDGGGAGSGATITTFTF